MNKSFTLYGRQGSGSFCVQVALEEIGAPYERVWIGTEPADLQRYREVNPTGRVPALTLPDGTTMFESAAILTHLSLQYPDAKLAPQSGTTRHAKFLQWMTFLSANMYEEVLRVYYSARYSARGDADAGAIREQALSDFTAHAAFIAEGMKPYVLGADYSIADIYLYMLAGWHPEKERLFAKVPVLATHAAKMLTRPAVAKVEADHAAV